MDSSRYEEILRKGDKTEWYGIEVHKDLVTNSINLIAENLINEINKLNSSLGDLKGVALEKRKSYLNSLNNTLQMLPYKLNGDFYLIKKRGIEEELKVKKKVIKKNK